MKLNLLKLSMFLIAISLFVTGCSQPDTSDGASDSVESAVRNVPVEVGPVKTGNIAATFSYTGDLRPTQELVLVSVVSGVIEEVFVEVGDRVRTGDPILQVVDTTFQAQVKQAKSGLTQAQINLNKMRNGPRAEQVAMAEAGLYVAQANLSKLASGPRTEQVQIAAAALDGAQAQLDSILTVTEDERTLAVSNLAQAEAALRLAQAEYDKVKWAGQVGQLPQTLQLQQATIAYETALAAYNRQVNPDQSDIAPLQAGIRQAELGLALAQSPFVGEDFMLAEAGVKQAEAQLDLTMNPFTEEDFALAELGIQQAEAAVALAQFQLDNSILRAPFDGVVSEVHASLGGIASPQSPAITLISEELEVQVEVPEKQVSSVYLSQPASIRVSAYPREDFPALVTIVAPAADTTSHTFPTVVTPEDEGGKLMAGMFANVTVLVDEKVGVVLVPRSAVATVGDETFVYLVSDDEKTVSLAPVTTGLSDADRYEIVSGLNPGQSIVLSGLSALGDGARIEIVARSE
ncbi:MAG: efflux RND transporter periplasmic adaptor subunit [Chloroflexota bacterium]